MSMTAPCSQGRKAKPLAQFSQELPERRRRYGEWSSRSFLFFTAYLEQSIPYKASTAGCLDMYDLVAIAGWGGNARGRSTQLQGNNSNATVRAATGQAIKDLAQNNWRSALQDLKQIRQWGPTYRTKTLRFLDPQNYVAYDDELRQHVKVPGFHLTNGACGYGRFLKLCGIVRSRCQHSCPVQRTSGPSWWLADVEMAIFALLKADYDLV